MTTIQSLGVDGTVREVLREIDRRFGDFVEEEWARRSPALGPKREFVAAVRQLYRSAHRDEAEASFDALLESKAAEIYEQKLRAGRASAMRFAVQTPPPPPPPPRSMAAPTVVRDAPLPWTPPSATASPILAALSEKLKTRIEVEVDRWHETVDGSPLNIRLVTRAQAERLRSRDREQLIGIDVHQAVLEELTRDLDPEECIGDHYTDEELMQIKTRRAGEVRRKHTLLNGDDA